MALHPDAATLSVQRLGPPDLVELFGFLDRDPVLNVYLLALTLRDALARPQEEVWAARRGEELAAVVHLGGPSGAVLPVGDDVPALDLLADETLRRRAVMPRRIQVVGLRAARALGAVRPPHRAHARNLPVRERLQRAGAGALQAHGLHRDGRLGLGLLRLGEVRREEDSARNAGAPFATPRPSPPRRCSP